MKSKSTLKQSKPTGVNWKSRHWTSSLVSTGIFDVLKDLSKRHELIDTIPAQKSAVMATFFTPYAGRIVQVVTFANQSTFHQVIFSANTPKSGSPHF